MALLPAYAVDGGRVPAQMLRMVAWAATNGANGVVQAEDLKVVPLATPGGAVQIMPGGALLTMRFPGTSQQQTYAVVNDAATTLTIPATGSGSGRTDYVIVRIDDPNFGGQTPPDPLTALYCEFARVTSVTNLPYPHVVLARIDIPASTGTITAGMITDMRKVAIPRRERMQRFANASGTQDVTSSTFIDWPTQANIQVEIPSWATKALVRADVLEALHTGNANTDGEFVLMLGSQPAYTDARRYDEVWSGSTARVDEPIAAAFNIPASMRGTTANLRIRARRLNGSGYLRADAYTQVIYDIEFLEEAV